MRRESKAVVVALATAATLAGCRGAEPASGSPEPSGATEQPSASAAIDGPLACAFEADQRLAYTLETQGSLVGDLAALGEGLPSDASTVDMHARVDLNFTVLDPGQSAKPALVQVTRRAEDGTLTQAVAKIGRDCEFVDLGFPDDVDDERRRTLLDELAVLEFAGPPAGTEGASWTSEQALPNGKARMAYRAETLTDGRVVIDRRVASMLDDGGPRPLENVGLESGRVRAFTQPGRPWLEHLDLERRVVVDMDGAPTTIREEATLSAREPSGPPPNRLDANALRWAGEVLSPYAGHNRTYPADKAPPGLDQAPLEELAARLVAGFRSDDKRTSLANRHDTVYAMRARTDLGPQLVEAAATGSLSRRGAGELLLALTDAGTPEAESALIDLINDPRTPADLRRGAVMQMHRQVAPGVATVDLLLEVAGSEAVDERTRHTAWASLGALVGFGRLPLDLEARARDALTAALKASADQPLQLTLLSALGNTRQVGVLEDVRRFTASDFDPTLRVHAMVVMERMGAAPSPKEILSLTAELDDPRHTDRLVRLVDHGYVDVRDADIADASARLSAQSPKPLRMAAVMVLGRRAAARPAIRTQLAQWYVQETDPDIKREIGRHVPADVLRKARLAARAPAPTPTP